MRQETTSDAQQQAGAELVVRPRQPLERALFRLSDADDLRWQFVPRIEFVKKVAWEFKRAVRGIGLVQAQNCLAYIYGFPSWNDLILVIKERDVQRDSAVMDKPLRFLFDERLEPEVLEARRSFQARRVFEWLSLEAECGRDLILQLRPSAGKRGVDDTPLGEPSKEEDETDLDAEDEDELSADQDPIERQWRFVPPSIEVAVPRYWKIKRLVPGLTKGKARQSLAYMCGFRSWKEMKDAIVAGAGDGIQRTVDEHLTLEELDERRAFQARRAQRALDLDMPSSRALVQLVKPSAPQRPRSAGDLTTDPLSVEDEYDENIWRRLNQG